MNKLEHIEEAERLLETAKKLARDDNERNINAITDLLRFSQTHAYIAQAMPDESPCAAQGWDVDFCVMRFDGACISHGKAAQCFPDINDTDGSDYN